MAAKLSRRERIRYGIRKKVKGTGECPRMSVFRSNKNIFVQFIDDQAGRTLAAYSSLDESLTQEKGLNKIQQAELVGAKAGAKAKEVGISRVVFDRGGYLYHGRVKALADAARKSGLIF